MALVLEMHKNEDESRGTKASIAIASKESDGGALGAASAVKFSSAFFPTGKRRIDIRKHHLLPLLQAFIAL